MDNSKVGVLVCSCDKNEDLWDMFFFYLDKHWKNTNYNIYLNTESKIYDGKFSENVKTFSYVEKRKRERWSLRLKQCLKQMEEDYVLLILDDFFLIEDVDTEEIDKCVKRMDTDSEIACFLFGPTPGPNLDCEYERFELKTKKAGYRFSLDIGLWRKERLIHYLRNHEGPWQFESWGSRRSRRYKEKFYCLKKDAKRVFTFPVAGVIQDGHWNLGYDIHALDFLKEDFDIDYEKRGSYHKGDPKVWSSNRSFIRKVIDVIKSLI